MAGVHGNQQTFKHASVIDVVCQSLVYEAGLEAALECVDFVR